MMAQLTQFIVVLVAALFMNTLCYCSAANVYTVLHPLPTHAHPVLPLQLTAPHSLSMHTSNTTMAFLPVASSPGPFEKSEKRAWYPLFAHALNFPTFQEFRIIPWYLRMTWRRYVYFVVYLVVHCCQWLFVCKAWILPSCMPSCDFEAKRRH